MTYVIELKGQSGQGGGGGGALEHFTLGVVPLHLVPFLFRCYLNPDIIKSDMLKMYKPHLTFF